MTEHTCAECGNEADKYGVPVNTTQKVPVCDGCYRMHEEAGSMDVTLRLD